MHLFMGECLTSLNLTLLFLRVTPDHSVGSEEPLHGSLDDIWASSLAASENSSEYDPYMAVMLLQDALVF
jgi:hypothetical protein